ncbi:hypothetical protein M2267_003084 [Ensifer sp. KUDG1]
MTGFGFIASLLLIWAWLEPEKVGRWLARVKSGAAAARQEQGAEQ